MNSHIDFRTLPSNVPSLCIPRVFTNWTESRIRRIFDDLSMGEILRIDVISKTTEKGEKFNRVFVHFKRWFSNQNADMARERLLNGKEIKIVYDDPWFWKVSAYRETKKNDYPDRDERPRASIQFDDDRRPRHDDDRRPSRNDDRRPSRNDDRRPRRNDDRRPDSRREEPKPKLHTKEEVDKHLDEINKANGNLAAISKTEIVEKKSETKTDIFYDMDMISQVPKRKILIKKEVKTVPLKIEIEEGEITDNA